MNTRRPRNQHFCLYAEKTVAIKSLPAFQKHFKVPTESNHATREFVAKLAQPEIELAADQLYENARRILELKRRQILMEVVGPGTSTISTPEFSIELSAQQDEQSFGSAILSRRIFDFKDLNRIADESFNQFAGRKNWKIRFDFSSPFRIVELIDRLEELDSNRLRIEYDRSLDWLELAINEPGTSAGRLLFSRDFVELNCGANVEPASLIEPFAIYRTLIADLSPEFSSWNDVFHIRT